MRIIGLIFILLVFSNLSAQDANLVAIRKVMADQETAWNNGNLEAFMQGYWQSDSLTFIGKNGLKRGWAATLAGYQKGYPDRATMGTLKFTLLKMERLSNKYYYVIGRWQLTRTEAEDVGGSFTLIWRKIKGKWLIVSDHSS